MLSYLFTSSVLLFVFAVGYYVFLKQAPALGLRRRILLLGMVGIAVLPLCPVPSMNLNFWGDHHPVRQVEVWQQESALAALPQPFDLTVDQGETIEKAVYDLAARQQPFWQNPLQLALVVYALGVLFLLGKIIAGLFRLIRLRRKSYPTGDGSVRVLSSGAEAFTFGPTVYLSQAVYDSLDAEVILTHERAHAEQWHTLDALMAEVLRAALWFHPMAWWVREQVQLNLEYLADATVLAAGYDKKDYQLSLVAHQQGVDFRTSLLPQFAAKGLKRRIQMMSFRAGSQVRSWVATAGLVLVAFVAFTVTNGKAQPVGDLGNETLKEDTQPINLGTDDIINENTQTLDLFVNRIPTAEELNILRDYLIAFSGEDGFVYQDCSDPSHLLTFAIGQADASNFTSVKGIPGVELDGYIEFKRSKDENGLVSTSMVKHEELPADMPAADILLVIDGGIGMSIDINGLDISQKTYETRKPLSAQLKCQLGFTPENSENYKFKMSALGSYKVDNDSQAKGYIAGLIAGITVDSVGQLIKNPSIFSEPLPQLAKYFISNEQVTARVFTGELQRKAWSISVAARKDGPEDQVVVRLDPE